MENSNVWIPVVIAAIASLPGILALLKGRRKEGAEAAEILINNALHISDETVKGIEKRMASLECEVKKLKKREKIFILNQKELLRVIQELKDIMKENGIDYDIEPELIDVDSE